MYRERLYEHLNVLDGNIAYICIADNVMSVLGLFWGSFRALLGAFVCSIQRIRVEQRESNVKH